MILNLFLAQAATSTDTQEVIESTLNNETVQKATESFGLWSHILHSDPLVKLTLLLLIGFSVTCWAVIFFKIIQLRNAQKQSQNFWQKFSSTPRISEMLNTKSVRQGPVYEIFSTGQQVLGKLRHASPNQKINEFHRNMLLQRISQSREEEVYKLEQYVGFLATTASVAPFIGLFGTVWGILSAFMEIGKQGTSSLATVGPYIAEALVATAVGLFAAIPAVIAYNYFVGKIRLINKMIDLFVDDFMLKSEQESLA